MAQMTGTSGGNLSDKEIAEDLLTSKKYLSNYYYAPAILESSKEEVRSAFREVHSDVQQEAKEIFDYLNMRGWYNVRQADGQSINDLRNTANQSRQVVQNLSGSGQGSSMGSGSTGQWTGTQYGEGQSGMGPSSLSQGVSWGGQPSHMSAGIGTQNFGSGVYQGYSQQGNPSGQWTGTQYGEGQSGMGPSSLSQGVSWGGQPSHMSAGIGAQSFGSGVYQGYSQQGNLPSWTRGSGLQGQQSSSHGISGGGWTGTQYGEGQSGMGPSSLSQGVSWGGQPSHMSAGIGTQSFGSGVYQGGSQQGNLPSWTRGSGLQGQQSSSHGISGGGWTGTQYGEGQSGMGPSSLSQGASWGGQPSQMNAGMGTQTFGSGVYQGYSQQTNLPSWTRGTGLQGNIGQQPGSFGQGLSNLGPGSQQYSQ